MQQRCVAAKGHNVPMCVPIRATALHTVLCRFNMLQKGDACTLSSTWRHSQHRELAPLPYAASAPGWVLMMSESPARSKTNDLTWSLRTNSGRRRTPRCSYAHVPSARRRTHLDR